MAPKRHFPLLVVHHFLQAVDLNIIWYELIHRTFVLLDLVHDMEPERILLHELDEEEKRRDDDLAALVVRQPCANSAVGRTLTALPPCSDQASEACTTVALCASARPLVQPLSTLPTYRTFF